MATISLQHGHRAAPHEIHGWLGAMAVRLRHRRAVQRRRARRDRYVTQLWERERTRELLRSGGFPGVDKYGLLLVAMWGR